MVSIKDVANLANTSIATVSNVLTKNKKVSSDLEEKVLNAIKTLGYKTNPIASGLRSKKTNTVGVIITSFQRVFFGQILSGIQQTLSSNGYMLSVFDSNDSLEKEKHYIKHFANSMVDGIIFLSMLDSSKEENTNYIHLLENLGLPRKRIPVVSLERNIGSSKIDIVMSDNYLAATNMMDHLIELGHRKIAHITGPMNMPMCQERLRGYRNTLVDKNKIEYEDDLIKNGDFSPISGYLCMADILNKRPDITAVFAANDQMAVGAMKAIKDRGLSIPKDIAVAGFDNIFPATLTNPPLTSINIARYQMGIIAAERILKHIDNDNEPVKTTMIKTQIVIRKSTDPTADSSWDLTSW